MLRPSVSTSLKCTGRTILSWRAESRWAGLPPVLPIPIPFVPEALPPVCRGGKVILCPLRLLELPGEMDSDDRQAEELYFHDRKTIEVTRPKGGLVQMTTGAGDCPPWDTEGEEVLEHVCTDFALCLTPGV